MDIKKIEKSLESELQKVFGLSKSCKIKWNNFHLVNDISHLDIDFFHSEYEDLNLHIYGLYNANLHNDEEILSFKEIGFNLKQFYSHEIKNGYSKKEISECAEDIVDSFIINNIEKPDSNFFQRQFKYDINDDDGMYASFNIYRRATIRMEGNSELEEKIDKVMIKHLFMLKDIQLSDEMIDLILEFTYSNDLLTLNFFNDQPYYWNDLINNDFIKEDILQIFKGNNDIGAIKEMLKINYKI